MAHEIAQIVQALSREGSSGFRASQVAKQSGSPLAEVQAALMELVEEGMLELRYQLICPDNGRTIKSFSADEELPIGQEVSDGRCETEEPFVVEKSNIWVTFRPSEALLRAANRELSEELKKNCLTGQVPERRCQAGRTAWTPMSVWAL